jgi:hypothetical protein
VQNWPAESFGANAEIFKPPTRVEKQKRFFVAIRGIDENTDMDELNHYTQMAGCKKIDRIIKKKSKKFTTIVKAEMDNESNYNEIISKGLFVKCFHFKVTEWEFFDQPLQCFKCQKYGHRKENCKEEKDVCLICAGNHSYKICKNKSNVKCANCGGNHSSVSKECRESSKIQSNETNNKQTQLESANTNNPGSTRTFNSRKYDKNLQFNQIGNKNKAEAVDTTTILTNIINMIQSLLKVINCDNPEILLTISSSLALLCPVQH